MCLTVRSRSDHFVVFIGSHFIQVYWSRMLTFVVGSTQFKLRRIGGRNGATVRLTPRQGGYNDAIGFWRAGNEHSNAHCKTDRILNTVYRGNVFTKSGWDILAAAAKFSCNKRAVYYNIVPTAARDLSVFEECPVMNRAEIAAEADEVHAAVKARFAVMRERRRAEAQAPAVRARGRGGRGGVGAGPGRGGRGRGGRGGISAGPGPAADVEGSSESSEDDSGNEDEASASDGSSSSGSASDDAEDSSSSSSDDEGQNQYHLHGDALRLARGQALRRAAARRDRDAAGIDDGVQSPTVGSLYVWDSPLNNMLFDIRITSVNAASQVASFEYLPPHDYFDGDTRPWAELKPKDPANAGRSVRRRTSRYDRDDDSD